MFSLTTSTDSVCLSVSMYLCIYVSMYVSVYLCIYVTIYLCICVSMYVCSDTFSIFDSYFIIFIESLVIEGDVHLQSQAIAF